VDLVVDGLKKVLHNLVSLLLTNKTIRSEAQKVVRWWKRFFKK